MNKVWSVQLHVRHDRRVDAILYRDGNVESLGTGSKEFLGGLEAALESLRRRGERSISVQLMDNPVAPAAKVFWVVTEPLVRDEARTPMDNLGIGPSDLAEPPATVPGSDGTCDNEEDADGFHEDADELRARIARGEG